MATGISATTPTQQGSLQQGFLFWLLFNTCDSKVRNIGSVFLTRLSLSDSRWGRELCSRGFSGIIPYPPPAKCRTVSKRTEFSSKAQNGQEAHRGGVVLAVGKEALSGSEQRAVSPRQLPVKTPPPGRWVSQKELSLLVTFQMPGQIRAMH